jgi:hypothetical protein
MMKLRKGVDVLVATPGRLLDLHRQNAVKFDQCRRWCWTKPTACSTWASPRTDAVFRRAAKAPPDSAVLGDLLRSDPR